MTMAGLAPTLLVESRHAECVLAWDELPVAALVCRERDRQCVDANQALLELTGLDLAGLLAHGIGGAAIEPQHAWGVPGYQDARLRRSDEIIAVTVIGLPVLHASEACVLSLFVVREPGHWRNVDLAAAIDEVVRDDMGWLSGAVLERLARQRPSLAGAAGLADLTVRERQVLSLVCEGCSDAHIAMELAISRNTLRNHISNIYSKTGVRRRSELVVWGRDRSVAAF